MSTPPPKIDQRSYEDIVAQTEAIAERTLGWANCVVEPTASALLGRTLAQDVVVKSGTIASRTVITKSLADQISKESKELGLTRVRVVGWRGMVEVNASEPQTLVGWILNQDVIQSIAKTDGEKLVGKPLAQDIPQLKGALRDTLVNENLAQQISQSNLTRVDVILASWGTRIDENLAQAIRQLPNWQQIRIVGHPAGALVQPDVGQALIRIFGRMVSLASDRLNRVPEKHFLSFLELIGTHIQPPQPARVPLTFFLVERNEDNPNLETFVPAGTQVAAAASEGQEEVVFETEQDLVVTSAQLQAVYIRQPQGDKYSDRTEIALGKATGSFLAFEGDVAIEHSLYLALDDKLVALPGSKTLTLTFSTSDAANLSNLLSDWTYWDGKDWRNTPTPTKTTASSQLTVEIRALPVLQQTLVDGKPAAWLRVKLSKQQTNPSISSIQAKVEATGLEILPDRCLLNTTALDLSKDFFPFGEQPVFNDTLYLAHATAFIPGGTVTLTLTKTPEYTANLDIPFVWEIWDGAKWTEFTPAPINTTNNWRSDGSINITLPTTVKSTEVNDEANFWIRGRVNKSNFGKELPTLPAMRVVSLTEELSSNKKNLKVSDVRGFLKGDSIQILGGSAGLESAKITDIDPAQKTLTLEADLKNSYSVGASVILQIDNKPTILQAPLVKTLKITGYKIENQSLAACLTINDFQSVDCTKAAASNTDADIFQPFMTTTDPKPTLYLGFDQPFPNRAIALYAQIAAATADEIANSQPPAIPPRLVWQYSTTNDKWETLNVQDGTDGFSKRGFIRFIGPSNVQARQEFGRSLYWLRVQWDNFKEDNLKKSSFRVPPKLERWLTNTTWATQSTTLSNEILGSSDGNPDQRFYATQVPILLGQRLEVQESTFLPPNELTALQQASPNDVTVLYDDIGQIEATWVRWHEVLDFYDSSPHDRHYRLDRLTGEIRFGDGKTGKVPPQGRQNIRLSHYCTGGGNRGNLPAQTIKQLKTTIPYIDSVSNLEPSSGGAEQESLERLQDRGPKILRHRDKAVTVQDFEDLTFAASTDIARVLVTVPTFTPTTTTPKGGSATGLGPLDPKLWFDPNKPISTSDLTNHNEAQQNVKMQNVGQVRIMIVPRSPLVQPIPSLALVEQVEAYLRSRCAPSVQVQVMGPSWVQVSVEAKVVPLSLEAVDGLTQTISQRLTQFLHPLTGGMAGQGWPFGREPHESDLYAVIEAIDQVAYVQSLTLKLSQESLPNPFLTYSGIHSITLA